jgi:glucose/arabinose dehydrogenase
MRILTICVLVMINLPILGQDSTYFAPDYLRTEVIAHDLKIPWELLWGPDDKIWFTERDGNIKRLDPETGKIDLVHWEDDVFQTSENSGMHSMAFHPNFPEDPYLFVHYCYLHKFKSQIVRYTYYADGDSLGDRQRLLWFNANSSHNGSRIVFDSDSTFFFSLGDAYARMELPQDTLHKNGKILHMMTDGTPAPGNPIPDSPVWSIGHRNPQGLVLADNGMLYSCEHGTNVDDELNLIERFRNYGWPRVAGMCDDSLEMGFCDSMNVREPLLSWTPTIAPCGLEYYGKSQIPAWNNCLLVCTMKGQHLKVVQLSADGKTVVGAGDLFENEFGRIRDALEAPDGSVYISTSNNEINGWGYQKLHDDRIIRIYNEGVHSPMRSLDRDLADEISVHSDEHNSTVRVSYYGMEEALMEIYTANGEQVASQTMVDEIHWMESEGYAPGLYTIHLSRGDEQFVEHIVLR